MGDFDAQLVAGRRRPGEVRRWQPSAGRRARTRRAVFARDDWTCQGCGLTFHHDRHPDVLSGRNAPTTTGPRPGGGRSRVTFLELHHVVPYRDGGEFRIENLQALCTPCNAGGAHEVRPAREVA